MRFAAAITLVATLALAMSFAPAGAAADRHGEGKAMAAKKKCKKGKKSAAVAKKRCKKKKNGGDATPPATVPAPTPAPLTAAEAINQVILKARQYCEADRYCLASGYYYVTNTSDPTCTKTTYTWACYGWNDEDFDENGAIETTCRFVEVIQRVGLNGVTSHQDLTYDGDGWYCFEI